MLPAFMIIWQSTAINSFIIDGAGFWLSFFLLFSKNIFLGMGIGKKGMRKEGHKKEEEEVRDG